MSETTDKIKFLGMEGTKALLEGLKGEYSPLGHEHSDLIEAINKITDGSTTVSKAEEAVHSSTADTAINAEHATSADEATHAETATKAEQDGQGNIIADTYALKAEAVLTVEQELTDEQKAIARANISKYDWKTFSDSYGTYTYAIDKNYLDYDIAQTVLNTSNNGDISALEDIVSWTSGFASASISTYPSVNNIQNIISNYNALIDGNAIINGTSLYIYRQGSSIKEDATSRITIGRATANNSTHCLVVQHDNFYTYITYNFDSNTITNWSSTYNGVTTSLTISGKAADAKVVGDALALKADTSVIESTYETKTDATTKLEEAKAYADQIKSDIYGGAPKETLDTITELATAFEENQDVVDALNAAITEKQDKNFVVTITSSTAEDGSTVYSADKTFAEIDEAMTAGKTVLAKYNMAIYYSDFYNTEKLIRFSSANRTSDTYSVIQSFIINNTTGKIAYTTKGVESVSNRIQILSSDSTASQYPSAKAVVDYAVAKTDYEAVIAELDEKASIQPDWNQNDESAENYIENRPFYTGDPIETTIVEETSFELIDGMGNLTATQPLEAGQEYIITLDGTAYNCVAKFNEEFGMPYMGNAVLADLGEDTGESFFIAPMQSETALGITINSDVTEHTISVIGVISEVHQIDPKYIKDMYYEYMGANTDLVLDAYLVAEEDNQWFNFSQFYLENFLVEGATYIVNWNDETYTCTAKRNIYGDIYIGNQALYDEEAFSEIIESNEPFFLYTFEEEFDYGLCMQTAGEYRIFIKGTGEKLNQHKIDMKYMPDNITYNMRNQQTEINNIYDNLNNININSKMDKENPTGTGSFSMNRKANTTIGNYSHAEGNRNEASGSCSHAEGSDTKASGNHSHAEGYSTESSGTYSHAEGYKTTASGDYSHTEGYNTIASESFSHAEGHTATASGSTSHAEGYKTTASGTGAHAEGYSTTASGSYSHAEGYQTKATTTDDTTFATTRTTKGYYTHAEGHGSVAYGAISHAEGNGTKASGSYSHAEGSGSIASSEAAHAEGVGTTASGYSSHAEGTTTIASGKRSHAEGWGTTASGDYGSHAEGWGTIANGNSSHVQGKWNIDDIDADGNPLNTYAHIVGNGTSDGARSNAHTLDWEGNGCFAGDVYVGGADMETGTKVLSEKRAAHHFTLSDTVTGHNYIVEMNNGQLISYCTDITELAVTTLPTKTEYVVGESLDVTGMIVTATCADGSMREVTGWTIPNVPIAIDGMNQMDFAIRYVENGVGYSIEEVSLNVTVTAATASTEETTE